MAAHWCMLYMCQEVGPLSWGQPPDFTLKYYIPSNHFLNMPYCKKCDETLLLVMTVGLTLEGSSKDSMIYMLS